MLSVPEKGNQESDIIFIHIGIGIDSVHCYYCNIICTRYILFKRKTNKQTNKQTNKRMKSESDALT